MAKGKQGIEERQNEEVEQIEMKIIKLLRIGTNSEVVLLGENNKQIIAPVQITKSLVDRREFRPSELNNFLVGKINSVSPIQPFIAILSQIKLRVYVI